MQWFKAWRRSKSDTDDVLRKVRVRGIPLRVYDYRSSSAADVVKNELESDCYGIERIPFAPGDVVVDIGGHVGIFSVYLAKRFPFIRIYSYEPIPQNYEHFKRSIELNRVTNVEVFNQAVTKDGRLLEMLAHPSNTGGATAQLRDMRLPGHAYYRVESVTLDGIFETHHIERCKLLKIDCEGSEYEILLNAARLGRVDYLSGEFHINEHLSRQGCSIEGLQTYLQRFIPAEHIVYTACHMAE